MDRTGDSAGTGAEHQTRASVRKLCSCGSFGEGELTLHPPGAAGDHPAVCECVDRQQIQTEVAVQSSTGEAAETKRPPQNPALTHFNKLFKAG